MSADIIVQIEPSADDWVLFNAVEVSPVMALDGIAETIDECQIGDIAGADYFWSVYLRFDPMRGGDGEFGGIICVADCRTKESAYALADELERKLASIIGSRLIPMHSESHQ